MSLEQLVYDVEARLLGLGRLFTRPDPLARLQEEIEQVLRELRDRRDLLARCDSARISTRRRLLDNQAAAALLTSQIEGLLHRGQADQAYRHALDLDRIRKTIADDQAALPRQDQACWSYEFQVRQLERRLARLRDQLPAC